MNLFVFSMVITVAGNTFYHLCQRFIAPGASAYLSLAVSFTIASLLSLLLFFVTPHNEGFIQSFRQFNWITYALGAVLVLSDLGYLLVYRSGWNLGWASLVSNILTNIILLAVVIFIFREHLRFATLVGIFLCMLGLAVLRWSLVQK